MDAARSPRCSSVLLRTVASSWARGSAPAMRLVDPHGRSHCCGGRDQSQLEGGAALQMRVAFSGRFVLRCGCGRSRGNVESTHHDTTRHDTTTEQDTTHIRLNNISTNILTCRNDSHLAWSLTDEGLIGARPTHCPPLLDRALDDRCFSACVLVDRADRARRRTCAPAGAQQVPEPAFYLSAARQGVQQRARGVC